MAYLTPTNINILLDKIKSAFPKLPLTDFEHITTGFDHDVLIVGQYAFRFPKSKYYVDQLYAETVLTKYLSGKINARVPIYDYIAKSASFARHGLVSGKILSQRIIEKFTIPQLNAIKSDLANFLTVVHNIDTSDFERFGFCENEYNQPVAEIPNLVPIHGDLDFNNMIWDDVEGLGIIDFGDRSLFDPAFDFTIYPFFGKEFTAEVYSKYQGPKDPNFLKRVDLYHQRYRNEKR